MTIKIITTVIFLVIIIIFTIVDKFQKREWNLIPKITEACCLIKFPPDMLPVPPINGGLEYSFSLWVYLASWDYKFNQQKIILYWKGKTIKDEIILNCKCLDKCSTIKKRSMIGKYGGLKVFLCEKENNLGVSISLLDGSEETVYIKNFPIQKWMNIIIVLKLRNFDIFLNGSLYGNRFLENLPLFGKHKLLINPVGGFDGYVSNLKYYNRAINYSEIKKIFKGGQ